MGQLAIDVTAVRTVADGFDSVARSAARAGAAGFGFGGATAGRDHVAEGEALRRALDALVVGLSGWARAAEEIAGELRSGAQRYAESARSAAARVG